MDRVTLGPSPSANPVGEARAGQPRQRRRRPTGLRFELKGLSAFLVGLETVERHREVRSVIVKRTVSSCFEPCARAARYLLTEGRRFEAEGAPFLFRRYGTATTSSKEPETQMKMRLVTVAALAAWACGALAQPIDSNAVIAKVDGQTITAAQFYHRMAYLDGVGVMEGTQFVAAPPAFLTVRRIIDEIVLLAVAKDKGVAPTQAEITAEVAKRRAENPETLKDLQELGITDDVIVAQVTQDLARFNLLTMGVAITDAQITNHYNVNKMVYVEPATITLRVIVVDAAADKVKVDEALKTKPFAEVAKTMSTDLTKMLGGELPEVPAANLPENVKTATNAVAAGKTTDWIESGGAFMKYLVVAKKEQKQLALDARLKADIKKRMMVIAGQQKNGDAVEKLIKEKRKTVNVQITAPGLQRLWNLLAGR